VLEHLNPEPDAPKRVVVIGAGGFVGGAIAGRLVAAGIDVLALGRPRVDLLEKPDLAGLLADGDAVVVVSAVAPCKSNRALIENLIMVDAVCAALAEVEPSHVVYVSSDAVYATDANPVTERSPCSPTDLHGTMHLARENMLRGVPRAPLAILRPSLLYGAADPHNGYGPNRFRRQAAAGETVTLFGEGEEKRDHVFIGDMAEIARLCLLHRSAGVLNVATGVSISFREVAETVGGARIAGTPRANPVTHRHFDIADCLRAFPGIKFKPLAEGLLEEE
jgi:UDP-glucose 4-epimerase